MPLVQDENGVYSFVMPQAIEPEAPAEQEQQPGLDAVVEAAQPVVEELTEAAAEDQGGFGAQIQQALSDPASVLLGEPGSNVVRDTLDVAASRVAQNLQNYVATELNKADLTRDFANRVGLRAPSAAEPNPPSPVTGQPLYQPSGNPVMDFVGDLTASGLQFAAMSQGLKGLGIKYPAIPIAPKTAATLRASRAPGLQGVLERTGGRAIQGAQEGYLPGALNDFFLENPYEGFGALLKSKTDGTPVEGFVNNYLAATDDDTADEARLKNAVMGTIAGTFLGAGLETVTGPIGRRLAGEYVEAHADRAVAQAKLAKNLDRVTGEQPVVDVEATAAPEPPAAPVRMTGRTPEVERDLVAEVNTLEADDSMQRLQQAADQMIEAQERVENIEAVYRATAPGETVPDDLPEPAVAELAPPSREDYAAGTVGAYPVADIGIDPPRFQFKEAGRLTKTGRSGSLAGTEVFNADLANVISVWRDPEDGVVYVVNGHNRLDAAIRAGRKMINVRFMEAANAAEARIKGAMQNISEGNGTAVDAAKIMRDSAMTAEDMIAQGMPIRSEAAERLFLKAAPLSKLPQELFDQVARGDMTVDIGAAIGSSGAEEQVMRDLAAAAKKQKWSAQKTAEAANIARFAQVEAATDPNALALPGFDQLLSSDFGRQLEVRVAIRSQLKAEINALAAAASERKAGFLEAAGNVINVQASGAARQEAMQGAAVFNARANMVGPLSDLITELAAQVTPKKKAVTVVRENLQRLRGVLQEEFAPAPRPEPAAPEARAEAALEPAPEPQPTRPEIDVEKLRRSLQHLSQEEFDRVLEKLQASGGRITSNPSRINEPTVEQPVDNSAWSGLNERQIAKLKAMSPVERAAERTKLQKMILGDRAKANREAKRAQQQADEERSLELFKDEGALADGTMSEEQFNAKYGPGAATSEEPPFFAPKQSEVAKVRRELDRDAYARQAIAWLEANTEAPRAVSTPQTPPTVPFKYGSPRYRSTVLQWESDVDALIYSVTKTSGRPSKNRDKFLNYLQNDLGLHENVIREAGARIRADLGNNATGDTYTVPDSGVWREGGQLADLPPVSSTRGAGQLGQDYTGRNVLSSQEKAALSGEITRVAGVDVNIEFVDRLEGRFTPAQARAYGGKKGQAYSASGMFIRGQKAMDDVIKVAMFHKANPLSFTRTLITAYHEAFHRLQDLFLSRGELQILRNADNQIRELAAKTVPEQAQAILSGQIGSKEVQAMAFSGWWKFRDLYKKATWAQPFTKISQIAEAAGNWLLGRGYQTWDDVFENAYQGDIAARRAEEGMELEPQLAVQMPDPDDVSRKIAENMEALKKGDITIEELLQDDIRRYASRSGKTRYIELSNDELAASFDAVRRGISGDFLDRADLTGRDTYTDEQINGKAIEILSETGADPDRLIEMADRALRGDLQAGDDLGSIRATQILLDAANNDAAIAAINYTGATTAADKASAASKLYASINDSLKIGAAYAEMTRVAGQRLRIAQMDADPNILNSKLIPGVNLQHATTEAAGKAALKEGLQPTAGPLGDGVYFTASTSGYENMAGYGGALVEGTLQKDIKIMDLPSMDKDLADLLNDLDLGRMREGPNGLELTPAQKAGLQDYVTGLGYQGLRHEPEMIGRQGGPVDEVVIYDVNAANRVVGSEAEAVPPNQPAKSAAEQFVETTADAGNMLDRVLPAEVVNAVKQNQSTASTDEVMKELAEVAIQAKNDKKYQANMLNHMRDAAPGSGIAQNIRQFHVMSILSAPRTHWTMLLGSSFKAATMPLTTIFGGAVDATRFAATGRFAEAKAATQATGVGFRMYAKYVSNLNYALRLTGSSFIHNEAFVNLGVDYIGMDRRLVDGPKQGNLQDIQMAEIEDGQWYMDRNNPNFVAIAVNYIRNATPRSAARDATGAAARGMKAVVGRPITMIDTFINGLVGPSAEWARLMDEQLEHAVQTGVGKPGSKEVWDFANAEAERLLQKQFRDVTMPNGAVIKKGALTGIHAKNVMDYVNFTDPLDIVHEPRTYQMGIRKARQKGLTDQLDIHNSALAYMKSGYEGRPAMAPLWAPSRAAGKLVNDYPLFGVIYALPRGPVNILKAAIRMTPGGGVLTDTFWRDFHSEDKFTRYRAVGDAALGTFAMASGLMLMQSDWIRVTGFDPTNWRERYTGAKAEYTGYQGSSISFRIPGTDQFTPQFRLNALDQLATIFGMLGEYKEMVQNVPYEQAETLIAQKAVAVWHTARELGPSKFNSQILEPFRRLIDLYSDVIENSRYGKKEGRVNAFTKYIATNLRAFMPNTFAAARVGPQLKPPGPATDNPFFAIPMQTAQMMRMRLPGASKEFPPQRHPFTGEPIPMPQPLGMNLIPEDQWFLRSAYNMFTPLNAFPTRVLSDNPIDVELRRLYGQGSMETWWSDTAFGPELPNRVLSPQELDRLEVLGTQVVRMTGDEVDSEGKLLAEEILDLITKNITYKEAPIGGNSANFERPSEDYQSVRLAKIKEVFNRYVREAKLLLEEESPALKAELTEARQRRADNAYIKGRTSLDIQRAAPAGAQTFIDALN